MIIELLMVLATISSSVSSSRLPPLEQVMRDTLKQVMRCPEWATDEDIEQPVAAFSPARYMQLVALVRKDSRENYCGRRSLLPFHLNNPRSWNFCAMGICSEDQSCSCFKDFVGEKCNKFQGRCWLFYCRLIGCNKEAPTLYCSCSPSLYGSPVARGLYFYDHGFEQNYIPPPFGYATTAFYESHLIRKTAPGQFEIIGRNHYRDIKAVRSYAEKKYSYSVPRSKYMYPVQDQIEQNFSERNSYNVIPYSNDLQREIYRKKPVNEESQIYPESPDNYRKPDRNEQYSKQKRFDDMRSDKWNVEDEDIQNSNVLQRSRSIRGYADANGYDAQPRNILSNFVPRITSRVQRAGIGMQMKSYPENTNRVSFQYPNQGINKFRNKWQDKQQGTSYLPRKSLINYSYNGNDLPLRNYDPDFRYNKGFSNSEETRRTLYSPDDYRMRRQQEIQLSEQSTIKETWGDDEEETDEDENFKFVSGSQANRFPLSSTFVFSIFIIFILRFLE